MDGSGSKKPIPGKEAKLKAARFCAYQERTHQEVRHRLEKLITDADEIEEIISELITENFINEERFAKAFVSGKYRIKKWGRLKIMNALRRKGLTPGCIELGLNEIEEKDYQEQIKMMIDSMDEKIDEQDIFRRKHKISKYLIRKGYEAELVWKYLDCLYPR